MAVQFPALTGAPTHINATEAEGNRWRPFIAKNQGRQALEKVGPERGFRTGKDASPQKKRE